LDKLSNRVGGLAVIGGRICPTAEIPQFTEPTAGQDCKFPPETGRVVLTFCRSVVLSQPPVRNQHLLFI
jgi:hypothetical protein